MTVVETLPENEHVGPIGDQEVPVDLDPVMEAKAREFVETYEDSRRIMYGIALGMSNSPETAEEIVQTALANAWSGLGNYSQGTNMRAWLCRTTKNTAINEYRRTQSRVKEAGFDIGEEEGAVGATSTEYRQAVPSAESIVVANDHAGLNEALGGLADEFRDVIVQVYLGDMSYREYSESRGVPMGTVMSRLHRGRAHLLNSLSARAGITPEEARVTRRGRAKIAAALAVGQAE